MTTIVATCSLMVADSQATAGVKFAIGKVHRIRGWLVGYAGTICLAERLIEYMGSPKRSPREWLRRRKGVRRILGDDAGDVELLMLSPRGRLYYFEWGTAYEVTSPFHAIGSGAAAALGALHAGASAEAAVTAATHVDPYSGGPVAVHPLSP